MDLGVLGDARVKLKESEEKDTYFDQTRESKKLWKKKVTFFPIIMNALGTVTKEFIKGLEDLEIRRQAEPSKLIHYWHPPEY